MGMAILGPMLTRYTVAWSASSRECGLRFSQLFHRRISFRRSLAEGANESEDGMRVSTKCASYPKFKPALLFDDPVDPA